MHPVPIVGETATNQAARLLVLLQALCVLGLAELTTVTGTWVRAYLAEAHVWSRAGPGGPRGGQVLWPVQIRYPPMSG